MKSSPPIRVCLCLAFLALIALLPVPMSAVGETETAPQSTPVRDFKDLDPSQFSDLLQEPEDRPAPARADRRAPPGDLPAIPAPRFTDRPRALTLYRVPLLPLNPGSGRLDPEKVFTP